LPLQIAQMSFKLPTNLKKLWAAPCMSSFPALFFCQNFYPKKSGCP
jgi:hypothetical protein